MIAVSQLWIILSKRGGDCGSNILNQLRFTKPPPRGWRLLVLARKIVFADGAADLFERRPRLPGRVEEIAGFAHKPLGAERSFEFEDLFLFGDRRQTDNFPTLLIEHVADEVVLVQALHDDDDRAFLFVVEATVKCAVIEFRQVSDTASSGFKGSSMMMISAPRPVRTPPIEVESLRPFSCVVNSCTDCFPPTSFAPGNSLL